MQYLQQKKSLSVATVRWKEEKEEQTTKNREAIGENSVTHTECLRKARNSIHLLFCCTANECANFGTHSGMSKKKCVSKWSLHCNSNACQVSLICHVSVQPTSRVLPFCLHTSKDNRPQLVHLLTQQSVSYTLTGTQTHRHRYWHRHKHQAHRHMHTPAGALGLNFLECQQMSRPCPTCSSVISCYNNYKRSWRRAKKKHKVQATQQANQGTYCAVCLVALDDDFWCHWLLSWLQHSKWQVVHHWNKKKNERKTKNDETNQCIPVFNRNSFSSQHLCDCFPSPWREFPSSLLPIIRTVACINCHINSHKLVQARLSSPVVTIVFYVINDERAVVCHFCNHYKVHNFLSGMAECLRNKE